MTATDKNAAGGKTMAALTGSGMPDDDPAKKRPKSVERTVVFVMSPDVPVGD